MPRSFVPSLLLFTVISSLPSLSYSQPYAWFPGSSIDETNPTGDKVVVVDCATDTVITPPGGWDYTSLSAEADPFTPAFSPDSKVVYLLTGSDSGAGLGDGRLYVFNAESLIAQWKNGQNPVASTELLDVEILSSNNRGGSEPSGITVDHATGWVYVSDVRAQLVTIFAPQPDQTLTEVARIQMPLLPRAVWTNADGSKAYVPCIGLGSPTIEVIDTTLGTPAIVKSHSVPLPAQTDTNSVPLQFVSCGFPMPTETSIINTPSSAFKTTDDRVLTIVSGHIGVVATFVNPFFDFEQNFTIDFPTFIYQLDTKADSGLGELLNSGDPVLTFDASGNDDINRASVLFPPLVNSFTYDNPDNQIRTVTTHIGGALAMQLNNDFEDLYAIDNVDSKLFQTIGQMSGVNGKIYMGSMAYAKVGSFNSSDFTSYNPMRPDSRIYNYTPPADGIPLGFPGTFIFESISIDRPVSIVIGQSDTKMFAAGSDALFFADLPNNNTLLRNSQFISFDINDSANTKNEVDLGLLIGAVAFQQEAEPGFPTLWMLN